MRKLSSIKCFQGLISLLWLVAACVNPVSEESEEIAGDSHVPFRFTGDVCRATYVRMQDNHFEEGDLVGVFAVNTSNSLEEERYMDNICFKRSADGVFTSDRVVYYPEGGSLDIFSYYPYQEKGIPAGETAMEVSVGTTQNLPEVYANSDFLLASLTDQYASKEPLSLTYKHNLFRLNIVIVSGEESGDMETLRESNPKLTVNGFYTKANYDFHENTYTELADVQAITPAGEWRVEEGRLVGQNVILIPQDVASGKQYVSLEVGGRKYRCWLPSSLKLQSGKQSDLEITFVPGEDVLIGELDGGIEDWQEGDDVQADSEMSRKFVDVSTLDFTRSNIYAVLNENKQVAQICKEYIVTEQLTAQALVAYPMKDAQTVDLSNGVVLQVLGQSGNVHGGKLSWNTEQNSAVYTPGDFSVRRFLYVLSSGKLAFSISSEDEVEYLYVQPELLGDIRNGVEKNYPLVKIGTQYWMRENLAASAFTNGMEITRLDSLAMDVEKVGYMQSDAGHYFYSRSLALSPELLPSGWRLPTWDDWNLLGGYLNQNAATLKSGTWKPVGEVLKEVNNLSGFSALPTGICWAKGRLEDYEGKYAGFWTLEADTIAEKAMMLSGGKDSLMVGGATVSRAYSIRGIRK